MKIAIIGNNEIALRLTDFFVAKEIHVCLFSDLDPLEISKKYQVEQDLLLKINQKFIYKSNPVMRIQKSIMALEQNSKRMEDEFQVVYESAELEQYEDFDFIIETQIVPRFLGGDRPAINEMIHLANQKNEFNLQLLAGTSLELSLALKTLDLTKNYFLLSFDKSIEGLEQIAQINNQAYDNCKDLANFRYPLEVIDSNLKVISIDKLDEKEEFFVTLNNFSKEKLQTIKVQSIKLLGSQAYGDYLRIQEPGRYRCYELKNWKTDAEKIFENILSYFSARNIEL